MAAWTAVQLLAEAASLPGPVVLGWIGAAAFGVLCWAGIAWVIVALPWW